MQLFDAICIGDAIVDLFVSPVPGGNRYRVDKDKEELAIRLGEKIMVDRSAFTVGGNATHVAMGLSRLGHRVGLGIEIGTDEFAEKILRDLDKERVSKNLLVQTPGAASSFTVSVSVGDDRVIFVSHVEREHHIPLDNVSTPWVFLTSMGNKWEEMYAKTLAFVKESGAQLAFNPGSTQMKKGKDAFADIIAACDILFVNKEEAEEMLYGKILPYEQKESCESLLFRLNRMGPKTVVITDGENGSFAIDAANHIYTQPVFAVEITEKTGAGDGFTAGFLAATMAGKTIPEALLWGTAEAAGVITKVGAQEGLLTKQELENMIQTHQ